MSILQSIADQLRELAQQTGPIYSDVEAAAGQLRQIAARVASLKQSGVDTRALEGAILNAEAHAEKAADAVRQIQSDGVNWANQLARGAQTGAATTLAGGSPGVASGPGSGGYVHPGDEVERAFANAVDICGAKNPSYWLPFGNPNYYDVGTAPWRNNCGSCARSFADAFQGLPPVPALGDFNGVPGESVPSMCSKLGSPVPTVTWLPGGSAADFTQTMFNKLEGSLLQQPPGTVAIVGVDWDTGGGHWFNAYVAEDNSVYWADLQDGTSGPWPPNFIDSIESITAVMRENAQSDWMEVTI